MKADKAQELRAHYALRAKRCPLCGQSYREHPALLRADNKTRICLDCGTREALESIGVGAEEQDSIIAAIHRSTHYAR